MRLSLSWRRRASIDPDEEPDISLLVEALIHISALSKVPAPGQRAIQSVALILDQLKLAGTGEAITSLIESKVDVLVEGALGKVTASLREVADVSSDGVGGHAGVSHHTR